MFSTIELISANDMKYRIDRGDKCFVFNIGDMVPLEVERGEIRNRRVLGVHNQMLITINGPIHCDCVRFEAKAHQMPAYQVCGNSGVFFLN